MNLFDLEIHCFDEDRALEKIIEWGLNKKSRFVCFCNSHTVYEAKRNRKIRQAVTESDLILPDGFPVVLGMKINGYRKAKRIAGPDMMLNVCQAASKTSQSIFLYGGDSKTVEKLKINLKKLYINLNIVGSLSPPYRELTNKEKEITKNIIQKANPNIIFVGLGFPKQEIWMKENKKNFNAVMLGVGAAFDFHAGNKQRAPKFMQNIGMEWFWRFLNEPKRLCSRYARANSYILFKLIQTIFQKHLSRFSI